MLTMKRFRGGALALAAIGALAGCDNPVGEGLHISPTHVEIRSGGELLVQGTANTNVTGQLAVPVADALPISVHYLRNGEELTVPYGYWLNVDELGGLATWEPTAAGAFTGTLHGTTAGAGTIKVKLMHGPVGSGHDDHSVSVPLTVTP